MLDGRDLFVSSEISDLDQVISTHRDDLFAIAGELAAFDLVSVHALYRVHLLHLGRGPDLDVACLMASNQHRVRTTHVHRVDRGS